jgi:Mg2+ and Co2+ transporter CorA
MFRALLFDSKSRETKPLDLEQLSGLNPSETQLLWVDLTAPVEEELAKVSHGLQLPQEALDAIASNHTNPALRSCEKFFWARVVAISDVDDETLQGSVLTLVAGPNLVVSLHDDQIGFIENLLSQQSGQSEVGMLGAASFTAALLDWQLSTYFQGVSDFEREVERIEVSILSGRPGNCLGSLRSLRKTASRLRRMLAPHREVFAGMARPDFRPQEKERAEAHFMALEAHFERAMDMVENARDLVVGSFELFSTQTALTTNDSLRILTFVTVVLGILAVIAGILGMNFEVGFFKSGAMGFAVAVGGMIVLAALSIWMGKRGRWF